MSLMSDNDVAARDPGLGASVLRAFLGALVIVALPAVVFWVLGAGDADGPSVIADAPGQDGDDVEAPSNDGVADDPDSGADAPDSAGDDPGDGADTGAGDETGAEQPDDPDAQDPEPDDPDPSPDPPAFPPAEVSVQVLDGHRGGDGSGARAVAAQLREAGYRIIAENPAIPYEVTTVLWTAGYEGQGRQVAAEIGAPEAREQPGTLSDQVMVHVVVGADRG